MYIDGIFFDKKLPGYVIRIADRENPKLLKELFATLSQNFKEADVLDWEEFGDGKEGELTIEEEKMLPIIDWNFFMQNGYKGKPSIHEDFDVRCGYCLVIKFKEPVAERIRTWARRKLKKK